MINTGLRIIAFLIAAAAFYFSNDIGWLAWIAPLPILLLAPHLSKRFLFLGAAASYWAGTMSWWSAESFVVKLPLFLGYHLVYAVVFALLMLWVRRTSVFWVFPLGWTAFEFLVALLSPEGTWASLAYTQTGYLSLMQNASIFGIYGVVFLVCLIPSCLAFLLTRRIWYGATVIQASLLVLIIVAASFWGNFRISNAPDNDPMLRIGLSASNATVPYEDSMNDANNLAFMKDYLSHVAQLANQGAKVVIFPEKLVRVSAEDEKAMETLLSQAASATHVYVEVGVKLSIADGLHNKAWIFDPGGSKIVDYDKVHLVPGLEDNMVRGDAMATFTAFNQTLGTVICKDLDFPAAIRAYGRDHVGVILAPSWDWKGSERIHSRMAVVRGIENGFAVARPSREGLVTASDRYGRILVEASTFKQADVSFVADVPISPQLTLYSKFGDWFGWLILGLTILAVPFTTIWKRKQHSGYRLDKSLR